MENLERKPRSANWNNSSLGSFVKEEFTAIRAPYPTAVCTEVQNGRPYERVKYEEDLGCALVEYLQNPYT